MIDKTINPNVEVFNLPEGDKAPAKSNPYKPGDAVRLRDGGGSNGTVVKVFGNEVLIAWDGVRGEPKWYHQDEVAVKKQAPAATPNPFKVGDAVRLRLGRSGDGTVVGIFGDGVRIEWAAFPGEPEWHPQDRVEAAKKPAGPAPAVKDNQLQQSIFDQARRLVASMDDDYRRRFMTYLGETYK
jgi:hypothetical protein